jgi:hypothetical protein
LLPNSPLWEFKRAACGGADVAEFVVLLTCPLGPDPLAARGLTAVLTRAGPAGAVVDDHPDRRTRRGPGGCPAGPLSPAD